MMFVFFLPAQSVQIKLVSICQTVHQQFLKQKKVLLAVPNQEAARYLDTLLWKAPVESFTPHIWTDLETEESVAITCSSENINRASVLIHLCPDIHPKFKLFEEIYDLYDETDAEKRGASEMRQKKYTEHGCTIKSILN